MLKLLQVFLSIIFLKFRTGLNIIGFFIIVVTCNLKKIFFKTFRPYIIKSYITSNSKSTRAEVFLFVFLFLRLFFRFFLSFFKSFCIARRIICKLEFLAFWLKFFDFKVFYSSVLSLYLGRSNINRIIVLLNLIFHLFYIEDRLELTLV